MRKGALAQRLLVRWQAEETADTQRPSERASVRAMKAYADTLKTTCWQTLAREWSKYCKWRQNTYPAFKGIETELAPQPVADYASARVAAFKTANQNPNHDGRSIPTAVGVMANHHHAANAPPGAARSAATAKTSELGNLRTVARRGAKRNGGESKPITDSQLLGALEEGMRADAPATLRHGAQAMAIASASNSRVSDIELINWEATMRRLVDPSDGAALRHRDGTAFQRDEDFFAGRTADGNYIVQICIGLEHIDVHAKHHRVVIWKDTGTTADSTRATLLEMGERIYGGQRGGGAWTGNLKDLADWGRKRYTFGVYYRAVRAGGIQRSANDRGWPLHHWHDHSQPPSPSSRERWMESVFGALMAASGHMDPSHAKTRAKDPLTLVAFHSVRRWHTGRQIEFDLQTGRGDQSMRQRSLVHVNKETEATYDVPSANRRQMYYERNALPSSWGARGRAATVPAGLAAMETAERRAWELTAPEERRSKVTTGDHCLICMADGFIEPAFALSFVRGPWRALIILLRARRKVSVQQGIVLPWDASRVDTRWDGAVTAASEKRAPTLAQELRERQPGQWRDESEAVQAEARARNERRAQKLARGKEMSQPRRAPARETWEGGGASSEAAIDRAPAAEKAWTKCDKCGARMRRERCTKDGAKFKRRCGQCQEAHVAAKRQERRTARQEGTSQEFVSLEEALIEGTGYE